MKNKIQSAQIVVPCENLNKTLEFFTENLGFRLEKIFPADSPTVAVIFGYGVALHLEESDEIYPLTLNLYGDFVDFPNEIFAPDGLRICLIDEKSTLEIPESTNEFAVSTPEGENVWQEGRAGMRYRDLIPSRLGGRFIASHICIPDGGEVPDYVHFHKIRFQMIYCLSGWARLVYEDQGESFVMKAGDCVLQPPEIRHRVLESSAKLEVLEIGCPAVHETFADHQLKLPNETVAPKRIFGGQRFVHHIAEKEVWESSTFEGFEESETGISEATKGLADVRTFRANADTNFSVKHSGEFLFFFILKGNLRLSDSEGKIYHLEKSANFVLPSGEEYFIEATQGLEMVRVSLPAFNVRQ